VALKGVTRSRGEDLRFDPFRRVSQRFREGSSLLATLAQDAEFQNQLVHAAVVTAKCLSAGNKAMFFGNGGSAADAQHLAAEFVGRFHRDRKALAAVALTVNTSALTAIANDFGFAQVFSRQLEAIAVRGDVAFAISTSGASANVLAALQAARSLGLVSVGLTGLRGDLLCDLVTHCLRVPSIDTQRIQEAHILVGHILCEVVEELLWIDEQSSSTETA
jgi:D-sedoheptulose 7-phosphate isomerase